MSKDDAYQWLASILAAPMGQAHIGLLGEYYCRQVIEESKKVLNSRNQEDILIPPYWLQNFRNLLFHNTAGYVKSAPNRHFQITWPQKRKSVKPQHLLASQNLFSAQERRVSGANPKYRLLTIIQNYTPAVMFQFSRFFGKYSNYVASAVIIHYNMTILKKAGELTWWDSFEVTTRCSCKSDSRLHRA